MNFILNLIIGIAVPLLEKLFTALAGFVVEKVGEWNMKRFRKKVDTEIKAGNELQNSDNLDDRLSGGEKSENVYDNFTE